jgi:hypothetical protein
MTVRALWLIPAALVFLVGPLAVPAHAANSVGCSGSASSFNDQGAPIDKVSVPGAGGTQSLPFRIMWNGDVAWQGQTDQTITSGTWRVSVQNASWLFALGELVSGHAHGSSGAFTNDQGQATWGNSFTPSTNEPVKLPGTYEVDFTVSGNGGAQCSGALWVRVVDSPGRTPLWWLSLALIVAALIMFFVFGVSKLTRPILT